MNTLAPTRSPMARAAWRYDAIAVTLHWALALLLAGMVALGWFMMSVEHDPGAARYFELHKSLGLVVAMLVVLRLGWRWTHRPQPLPVTVPQRQARLASALQALLYLLMVLLPLAGYLGASSSKSGVAFFGLALPVWTVPDHNRAEWFFGLHSALAWALVVLVAGHTAAAVRHLFVAGDGVFQRMGFRSRH